MSNKIKGCDEMKNIKLWRNVFLFMFLAAGGTSRVRAVPTISGADGTFNNGSTITVSGSSFGAKATASPYKYDTFESGGFNTAWADTFSLKVANNNDNRHQFSVYAATKEYTAGNAKSGKVQAPGTVSPKWFCQFWVKVSTNWDWGTSSFDGTDKFLSNIKIFRLWNPGSTTQNVYMQYDGIINQFKLVPENTGDTDKFFFSNARTRFTAGTWHLLQMEYGENSSFSAADGVFRFWFDGSTITNRTNIITRTSGANTTDGVNNKRPYVIGFENEWNCTENGGGGQDASCDEPNHFSMDEIYLDTTWSRVELGNAATYNACTHREIQIPTSWSDTSVSFVTNVGSFSGGDTVYLYIVDSDGNANATGLSATIGSAVNDVSAPGISSTTVVSTTALDVHFNESVEEATAEVTTNYLVNKGISVQSATLDANLRTVHLVFTSAIAKDTSYILTISNVRDRAAVPNTIAANSQTTFSLATEAAATTTTTTPDALKPQDKFVDTTRGGKVTFGDNAVEVSILDAQGNVIAQKSKSGGNIVWDGRDTDGRTVKSGPYMSKIKGADGSVAYAPIMIIK